MKKRLLSVIATLVVGTGIVRGQALPPTVPPGAQAPGAPALPPLLRAGMVPDALPVLPVSTAAVSPPPVRQGPVVAAAEETPFASPQVVPLFGDQDSLGCPSPEEGGHPGRKKFSLFGCVWMSADALAWWVKGAPSPIPLVTTAPPGGSGFLNAPGTTTVFGGSNFDYDALYGGRFAVGVCEPSFECGLEFSGFFLSSRSTNFATGSSAGGAPLLARPFFDAILGVEDAQLISFPGAFAGDLTVNTTIDLWGLEANLLRHKVTRNWQGDMKLAGATLDTDVLAGFRFVNMNETLSMTQASTVLPGGVAGFAGSLVLAPSQLTIGDQFLTTNNFYGGQVGFQSLLKKGCCFAGLTGKVALGSTYQVANILGTTTLSTPGAVPATVQGGLFALPTNIGVHGRNAFAVIPEVGVNVGVELFKCVRLYGGYNFLYWSDVVRPGDQIDRSINKTQLPSSLSFGPVVGPLRPVSTLQTSDFWAHGLNAGVAIRY